MLAFNFFSSFSSSSFYYFYYYYYYSIFCYFFLAVYFSGIRYYKVRLVYYMDCFFIIVVFFLIIPLVWWLGYYMWVCVFCWNWCLLCILWTWTQKKDETEKKSEKKINKKIVALIFVFSQIIIIQLIVLNEKERLDRECNINSTLLFYYDDEPLSTRWEISSRV